MKPRNARSISLRRICPQSMRYAETNSVIQCRDLSDRLFGFDFEQQFVGPHPIADIFVPLRDRAFSYRLTKLRHYDLHHNFRRISIKQLIYSDTAPAPAESR